MKIYIEIDINANRAQTRSARDFIAQQLPQRKAALQAAEQRLQYFKQQNRVLDLKAEASSSVAIITDLDRQIAATRSDLSVFPNLCEGAIAHQLPELLFIILRHQRFSILRNTIFFFLWDGRHEPS